MRLINGFIAAPAMSFTTASVTRSSEWAARSRQDQLTRHCCCTLCEDHARIPTQWRKRRPPASTPFLISTSRQGVARVHSYENDGSITFLITYVRTRLLCARAERASGKSTSRRRLSRRKHGRRHACTVQPSLRRVQYGRRLASAVQQYRSVVQHRCRRGRSLFQ